MLETMGGLKNVNINQAQSRKKRPNNTHAENAEGKFKECQYIHDSTPR